jgi:hypothetical protein
MQSLWELQLPLESRIFQPLRALTLPNRVTGEMKVHARAALGIGDVILDLVWCDGLVA